MDRPRLQALAAITMWGVSFVATKAVLSELPPATLIFSRFALGTAFLLTLLALRGEPLLPERQAWPALLAMGFVGVFVHQMLQAYALTLTSAVSTGWLIGLTPLWAAVLSAAFLGEHFGAGKLSGLALSFAGALLVVTGGRIDRGVLALPSTRGDLLILASTVNWAFYTVLGQKTLRRLGPTRATSGATLFGWLMLTPLFVLAAGWKHYGSLSAEGWCWLLFLGIGCSGLGYLFWYGALARIEASRVAAFLYIEPLVTLAAAALVLGEPIRASTVAGGLAVLAGVFIVQRAR